MTGLRPQRVEPRLLSEAAAQVGVAYAGPDPSITGITLDSRQVRPGDLYVALPGARTHGARFAAEAATAGAVAVVTDEAGRKPASVAGLPVLVVGDPRDRLGRLAAWVYGDPARDLLLIGVTGTSGKTTTTYLLESGLVAAGHVAGVIGTVGTRIGEQWLPAGYTTPEAPDLHALFALMRERGVTACAMEVSSHALVRGRVDGLTYDAAVFTNLGRDHLDFHTDLDDYFAAKARLFTPHRTRCAVVNLDDAHGKTLAHRLIGEERLPTITFGIDAAADWRVEDVRFGPAGASFTVVAPDGRRVPGGVRLAGRFNVSNALGAIAALVAAGLPLEQAVSGVAACPGVPGRMEPVAAGQPFLAVVDYAHKPDSLAAVLESLRRLVPGRLIVVFGAGGERDQGKRPQMGEVVARLADVMIVTDDNPRGEDPAKIRSMILEGAAMLPAGHGAEIHEVAGRREAIRLGVRQAREGDAVLVAGKGHEQGQEVAGIVQPFDDRIVLTEELRAVYG